MEEVRALAQVHVHRGQRGFDDCLRAPDLRPLDRDPQPGIGAAPAAEADEQVGAAFLDQPQVDARDLLGDHRRVPRLERPGLHVHHVRHVVDAAVAHHRLGREQQGVRLEAGQVHLHHRVRNGHRPDLQEAELHVAVVLVGEGQGELDLDRRAELLLARPQERTEQAVERELLQHEQRREIQHARSRDPHAHRQPVGRGVVGRGHVTQALVFLGQGKAALHQVLGFRQRVVRRGRPMFTAQNSTCVCRSMSRTDAVRRRRARVGGRVAPGDAAVHDGLAEAEREVDDAVLGARLAGAVEAVGARDAGDVRVEAIAVAAADDRLDDDRHPVVHLAVARHAAVRAGVLEERGGVDELDRLDQPMEARFRVVLVVGDHLGRVDARERLVEGVLEKTRRADGERRVHLLDQRPQVAEQLDRQPRVVERLREAVVRRAGPRQIPQRVLGHEGLEVIRRDDGQGRDADGKPPRGTRLQAGGEQVLHREQAVRLAPEGARANARETLGSVEEPAVERGDRGCRGGVGHRVDPWPNLPG